MLPFVWLGQRVRPGVSLEEMAQAFPGLPRASAPVIFPPPVPTWGRQPESKPQLLGEVPFAALPWPLGMGTGCAGSTLGGPCSGSAAGDSSPRSIGVVSTSPSLAWLGTWDREPKDRS